MWCGGTGTRAASNLSIEATPERRAEAVYDCCRPGQTHPGSGIRFMASTARCAKLLSLLSSTGLAVATEKGPFRRTAETSICTDKTARANRISANSCKSGSCFS